MAGTGTEDAGVEGEVPGGEVPQGEVPRGGRTRTRQLVAVGPEDGFPPGRMTMVEAAGRDLGVIRLRNGEFRAVRNYCPHKGAPICRGIVGGTWPPSGPGEIGYDREGEVLVCPWHGFEYDLQTGDQMFGTGQTRLRMYPVQVQGGQVYVTV